jgi:hypothetical protein
MAISSIGATSASQVTPVPRAFAPTPQSNSAASSIVVSKVTFTNSDGSTTTIITYADGHTETETTAANSNRQPSANAASRQADSGTSTGQLVNLLV